MSEVMMGGAQLAQESLWNVCTPAVPICPLSAQGHSLLTEGERQIQVFPSPPLFSFITPLYHKALPGDISMLLRACSSLKFIYLL